MLGITSWVIVRDKFVSVRSVNLKVRASRKPLC